MARLLFRNVMRRFRHRPAFALGSVLVFALGVGVATVLFAIVNAMSFRAPGIPRPDELRYVYGARAATQVSLRYSQYLRLTERSEALGPLTFQMKDLGDLRDSPGPPVWGEAVSLEYFEVLGVRAARGRTFSSAGAYHLDTPELVISDAIWRTRFGAAPDVVGRQVELAPRLYGPSLERGAPYTIVGVMPASFGGTIDAWEAAAYWVPFTSRARDYTCDAPTHVDLAAVTPILRVASAADEIRLAAALRTLESALRLEFHEPPTWSLTLEHSTRASLPFELKGEVLPQRMFVGLMLLAAFTLAIVAVNLSGVLLARTVARGGEIALCLLLGGSRSGVIAEVVIESLALALAGGAAGVALAYTLLRMLLAFTPVQFGSASLQQEVTLLAPLIDARVLGFALCASTATGLMAAIGPCLRIYRSSVRGMSDGGTLQPVTAPKRSSDMRKYAVLAPQVGLAFVLLVNAGSAGWMVLRSEVADPGFDSTNLAYVTYELERAGRCHQSDASTAELREARRDMGSGLPARAEGLPGVRAAAMTMSLPWEQAARVQVLTEEAVSAASAPRWVDSVAVGPRYFEVVGLHRLRGRAVDQADSPDSAKVVVISERLGQSLWPGRDPVGRSIAFYGADSAHTLQWREVVGVVSDVRQLTSGDWMPRLYVPITQTGGYARTIAVRSAGAPASVLPRLADLVLRARPGVMIVRVESAKRIVSSILYPQRLTAVLIGAAGFLAVALACAGLYGLSVFSATQRQRELGIRLALGATHGRNVALLLQDSGWVALLGLAVGVPLSFAARGLSSHFAIALPAFHPGLFAGTAALLILVVVSASLIGARLVYRIDPIAALRQT